MRSDFGYSTIAKRIELTPIPEMEMAKSNVEFGILKKRLQADPHSRTERQVFEIRELITKIPFINTLRV